MRKLLLSAAAIFSAVGLGSFANAQARPLPGPDVQQIYQRLLPQIEKIPAFDHHAHPGFSDDPDVDAMAAPPDFSEALRTRDDNPELIAAAKALRGYAEKGDEMALRIFEQQAKAIGSMFTIAANFTDPDAYFVGGGIVEAEPHFRDWCMDIVRASTELRDEQRQIVQFAVVPDLDMAGARGSALAALQMLRIAAT